MGDVSALGSLGSVASETMGKYALLGRLGRGGMADVFVALARGPQRVDKLVVIKRLHDPRDAELIQMFLDEARLAARLSHPNIVHMYEVAESNGEYFIAMEYLDGQPLNELTAQLGAASAVMSDGLIANIAAQALKGLHYAHEFCDFDGTPLGIVHRDVSPQNLFVTYRGEVKLLDFGIAKAALNATRTESGVLKGKVRYMAPEQAASKTLDRRADIFSFGVVLWELLARRPLFSGDQLAVLQQVERAEVPPLRSVRPDVPAALEAIVAKALTREKEQRYATAEEMRLDIERFERTCGETSSQEQLGQLVARVFADARVRLRERIKQRIAALESGDETPRVRVLADARDLPVLHAAPPENAASVPALTSPRPPWSSTRWRVPVAMGIAIAVAAFWTSGKRALAPPGAPGAPPAETLDAAARLRIETSPPGAFVEWKGARFGPTPTAFPIEAGTQSIRILRDGYETRDVTLDVRTGETFMQSMTLQPKAEPGTTPPAVSAAPAPSAPPVPHRTPSSPPAFVSSPASSASSARPRIQMLDERDLK